MLPYAAYPPILPLTVFYPNDYPTPTLNDSTPTLKIHFF